MNARQVLFGFALGAASAASLSAPVWAQAPDSRFSPQVNEIRPFVGMMIGAWSGGDFIETDVTGGFQGGIYGRTIGGSFTLLYYSESVRLMPLVMNAFFHIPIRERHAYPISARLGGGATYFLIGPHVLSDVGSQANIGLDFWLSPTVAIAVDGFYFFFNPAADEGGGKVADSAGLALMSLKYRFL